MTGSHAAVLERPAQSTGRPVLVRPATPGDVKALADVLARAFYDDPPLMWLLPDPANTPAVDRYVAWSWVICRW
jgi:hypothetical protein